MISCEKLPATRKENRKRFSELRSKLLMISNPTLRNEALFRFQHFLASSAVFDDDPNLYPTAVREAFDKLVVFLNNR